MNPSIPKIAQSQSALLAMARGRAALVFPRPGGRDRSDECRRMWCLLHRDDLGTSAGKRAWQNAWCAVAVGAMEWVPLAITERRISALASLDSGVNPTGKSARTLYVPAASGGMRTRTSHPSALHTIARTCPSPAPSRPQAVCSPPGRRIPTLSVPVSPRRTDRPAACDRAMCAVQVVLHRLAPEVRSPSKFRYAAIHCRSAGQLTPGSTLRVRTDSRNLRRPFPYTPSLRFPTPRR